MKLNQTKSSENSRVNLITGGAGFLGSHLCDRIIERGEKVICLDNFSTGSKNNINHLIHNKNFNILEHDIVESLDIYTNRIFNLACPASPIHYQKDPIKTTKTCVLGSLNMLEIANINKARILQASTSEVYGDPTVHPQHETYWGNVNPIGLRSCYDEGKRCAETLFFDFQRVKKLDIRVMRIFNTYGPRMHPQDGRVVSNFIVQALKGENLTIYGKGYQTRSFCYVDDLIDGMIKLMDTENYLDEPLNIGNPSEFTMIELAESILKLTSSKSKITFHKLPEDDPKQRKPDISKANSKLGWSPKVPIEDGLKETIKYFKSIIN